MTRRIEYLPLDDLTPDPRNPKRHDQGTIRSSIDRFGVADPIVRDDRTGYIISGHGRRESLLAMREAGQEPPDGVTVDDSGRWLVPVAVGWSSRSDNEAAAALIALNRSTQLGGWQDEALVDLLADLAEVEDGLDGVGFTVDDLTDLQQLIDDGGADLDDLAEQWDGQSGLEPPQPQPVTVIPLYDHEVAKMWNAHLDSTGAQPDDAIRALLK